MTTNLRPATSADLPAIHGLVAELAEFEKELPAFTATLEDYQQDFADDVFMAQVAETPEGEIVGMILYYLTYSTWKGRMLYLEDFVVKTEFRGMGIGQQLFARYLKEAQRLDCRIVKWQVLDWNTQAVTFYEKQGAIIEKEWWNAKIFL